MKNKVDIVRSTSASAIIPKLDRMFATHGIPTIVCSDNGPPFTSHEIQQYMEENGVQHRRITPLWPQANSEAERSMQPQYALHTLKANNGQNTFIDSFSTTGQPLMLRLGSPPLKSCSTETFRTSYLRWYHHHQTKVPKCKITMTEQRRK